jgi:chromosome segregation ATPase
MQQIHILDKQLREANRVIESKMRALDEQGLTTVDISSQMKALTRELEAAQREIGAFKEREKELKSREVELKQMVRGARNLASYDYRTWQGFEATAELDRIKKDLQRAQSHLSNVKNERDEALRQVDNLEARARLVRNEDTTIIVVIYLHQDRLERDRWRAGA